jgi:hypothetical protein
MVIDSLLSMDVFSIMTPYALRNTVDLTKTKLGIPVGLVTKSVNRICVIRYDYNIMMSDLRFSQR